MPTKLRRKISLLSLQTASSYFLRTLIQTHLCTVRRHCGGNIGSPVFLQQVYVALGSVPAPHMKQAEQLIHVVVDPELAHGSGG